MKITKDKILAVEGKDEVNFFSAFLKYLKINNIQIINFGGKNNFLNRIKTIVKLPNFDNVTHLALIRDADENYQSAFNSVAGALKQANLPYPEKNKNFAENKRIKVGVFIMPGKNKAGMLENLCIETIKEKKEYLCIENFINCLPIKPKNPAKTVIQTYLSTQNPIVNSLGLGAQKNFFDFSKMQELSDFFKLLLK